ncbi:zinc finger CCCH domain-containing protein 30-like [Impatiens glandulifera]|uniref:zinc finger CCCH domain-containing protein 30-like n=1 Tax=Impatiens glandulifera TaxID=253017 RepID=UPI001FB09BA1|nr:zinc finger CCCH domain-containing protein 30-like [Impatiens glandulifera]
MNNNNNNNLTVETEDTFASLLEFAANNDVQGFTRYVQNDPSGIHEVGLWYGRYKGSKQMVLEERTPLMVASMYGSVDVIKTILSSSSSSSSYVNRASGLDKSTALHCAASGGSIRAVEVIKLLLQAGADPNSIDANGLRPSDLIVVSPSLYHLKLELEELLLVRNPNSNSNSPPLSSSPDNNETPSSDSDSIPDIKNMKKEYPIDPSIPDIKNSIYSTDEFRMFSFKIRPCSRAYSHDWTECPFVHPGENARRRDPRKYHYSCVPCPDFRKGSCRRGDTCEYAHGVFECWLHPAQYRTRLCKDGIGCNRRVCFFAHTQDELRPLYVATGSAVLSPRSISSVDFSPFTPPMSPSGVNSVYLQSSRLRSSLNARDIPAEELSLMMDLHMQEQKMLTELSRVHSGRTKTNLDELFSAENLSPRFSQFQNQGMLSPNHRSSGRMSPRNVEPISPMNSRVSMLSHLDKHFRSLSCRELGSSSSGSPGDWTQWGSNSMGGKVDWSVVEDGQVGIGEEPDLSWVQSLVKESSPQETGLGGVGAGDPSVIGSWLEQMQLDQHFVNSKKGEDF